MRGGAKIESYFGRILAAVCNRGGGELRLKGEEIDLIDKDVKLTVDWDGATQEVVVRRGTRFLETYLISAEAGVPWQTTNLSPSQQPSNSPPASGPSPTARTSLSNEELARMEQDLLKRRVARLVKMEQEEVARREADMFKRTGVPQNS